MAKKTTFEIEVSGNRYEIEFVIDIFFNNHKVFINSQAVSYKKEVFAAYLGVDIPLKLGEKEIRLVQRGKFVDLAIDGFYLNSGEEYVPKEKMSKWNWIFILLCALLPIASRGGAIPVILALVGIYWVVRISVDPYIKRKVLLNTVIVASIYILMFLIIILLSMLVLYLGSL